MSSLSFLMNDPMEYGPTPRRVTRQRTLSATNPAAISSSTSVKSPYIDAEDDGDELDSASAYGEDDLPSSSVAASTTTASRSGNEPKRGRKPLPASSRTARELARKTNHSIIEKRRREKINEVLSALRDLVPLVEEPPLEIAPPSPAGSVAKDAKGKKASSDKEFKLEVLERTLSYVRRLTDKVQTLELQVEAFKSGKAGDDRRMSVASLVGGDDSNETARDRMGAKRKRVETPDVESVAAVPPPPPPPSPNVDDMDCTELGASSPSSPHKSRFEPSLPSISYLLAQSQFPSPPYFEHIDTSSGVNSASDGHPAPTLRLPPSASVQSRSSSLSRSPSRSKPKPKPKSAAMSPPSRHSPPLPISPVSPVTLALAPMSRDRSGSASSWTRDEENAASLLVQFSRPSPDFHPVRGGGAFDLGSFKLDARDSSSASPRTKPASHTQSSTSSHLPFTPGSVLGMARR